MDEAVVTASAYATGDAEAVTLQSLEVVTTPGAAADIFLMQSDVNQYITPPAITWRGVAIASVCWILYATFYSFMVVVGDGERFLGIYIGQLMAVTVMGVLSIPPWYLIVRRMDSLGWWPRIGVHVIVAPLYAWLSLEIFLRITWYTAGPEVHAALIDVYIFLFGSNLTAYIIQFALYHSFRVVQRLHVKEKQAAELQALAKESELAALKAQINPHFLFNTLNSISAMVRQDPSETREMIVKLGDMLRYVLDSSKKDLVTLGDEIAFVRSYLALEAHRFSDRLDVLFSIEKGTEMALVPPMVLQPLVENAIKHGISRREKGGNITIRTWKASLEIGVSVEDTSDKVASGDAPRLDALPVSSFGIGLANTRARLEKRLGAQSTLHTLQLKPDGFRVYFMLPVPDAVL